MKTIQAELSLATLRLPPDVALAMREALEGGSYSIGAGTFESELAVCPIVAAAKTVGLWVNGGLAGASPGWGTEDEPSQEVWDFIGSFDICAEEGGLDEAVRIVRSALRVALLEPASVAACL